MIYVTNITNYTFTALWSSVANIRLILVIKVMVSTIARRIHKYIGKEKGTIAQIYQFAENCNTFVKLGWVFEVLHSN